MQLVHFIDYHKYRLYGADTRNVVPKLSPASSIVCSTFGMNVHARRENNTPKSCKLIGLNDLGMAFTLNNRNFS